MQAPLYTWKWWRNKLCIEKCWFVLNFHFYFTIFNCHVEESVSFLSWGIFLMLQFFQSILLIYFFSNNIEIFPLLRDWLTAALSKRHMICFWPLNIQKMNTFILIGTKSLVFDSALVDFSFQLQKQQSCCLVPLSFFWRTKGAELRDDAFVFLTLFPRYWKYYDVWRNEIDIGAIIQLNK